MAALLDCDQVTELQVVDDSMAISAVLSGITVTSGNIKTPALMATWTPPDSQYVVGIQFEYVDAQGRAVQTQSQRKDKAIWQTSDGIVAGAVYQVRYRATGIEDKAFGEWSLYQAVPIPAEFVAGDTAAVAGIPAATLTTRLIDVEAIAAINAAAVTDLEEIYGDTVSAAESAIAAGEAANLAVLKAGEATDAASASNVSAGIASTKADEAGISATAANVSKLAAQLAETNSGNSAAASVISASQAQAYRDQSGEFASASSGFATAAETASGNASTFASQASTSAGNANTASISAGVSASTAREAANSPLATSPGTAIDSFGVNQWSTLNATANLRETIRDSGGKIYAENGALRIHDVPASQHIHTAKAAVRPANHRFKVAATYRRVVDGPTASTTLFFWSWDASGNILDEATIYEEYHTVAQGLIRREFDVTVNPNAAWMRTMLRVYSPTGLTEVLSIETIDGEGQIAAAASAAVATTQAASASASAASASISANLAASVGSSGSQLGNPKFLDWPTGQVLPTGWVDWANANTTNISRAVGHNSRPCVNMHYKAGLGDLGFRQDVNGIRGAGSYLLSADVSIPFGGVSGTGFQGAGVLVQAFNASDDFVGDASIRFALDQDNGGLIAGGGNGDGRVYRFKKQVSFPAGTALLRVYAMTRWTGFGPGGPDEEKILTWYGVDLETSSDIDRSVPVLSAQLSVTAAVAADAQTRLASARFEVIAAAGSDPAQLLVRADNTGSLAAMVATSIRLSNVVGGVITEVMRLEGGRALFANPISIINGGRRTTLGPGFGAAGDLHLWSGPSTVGFGSETIDNGILGVSATDGWFGGRNASGPFDSLVQAGEINLPVNAWTTVAQVSDKFLYDQAYIVAALSYEIYVSGAAGGSDDYSYYLRLLMTNLDGSNPQEVPLTGLFGFGANNTWIDLRALNFREATVTTSRGRKNFYFQINPVGANIAVAKARNRRLKGAWTQPIT